MPHAHAADQPEVTLILPVYNVEPYLALSLASVRDQTLQNIQVICVDDGSTDGSGEMLDMCAAIDARFTVIHKPNGGVSSAKNAGLPHARGRFIIFFDPDDVLLPNACERVAQVFNETDADIVGFGGRSYPACQGYIWLNDALNTRNATYEQFHIDVLMREKTRPFAWRTACRRSFLERTGVRYDEDVRYGEDQIFQFAVFPRSSKTVLIADKLVDYRVIRDGSFMYDSHRDDLGRIREHVQIVDKILADWQAQGILETYQQDMFEWTVELLMRDLVARTDVRYVPEAAASIAQVWERYFPADFLQAQKQNALFADMLGMVFDGQPAPSHLRARFIDWRYSSYRLGAGFVARRMLEHVAQGRIGNIGRAFKNALPIPTKQKQQRAWAEQESELRRRAYEQLQSEFQKVAP